MQNAISVVIPNYNGVHLFPETLPTVIRALAVCGLPSEIIIVDDHSTDGSISFLQNNYPDIRLIQNARNSGFSLTANRGVHAASHDLVLLLNSDVKLEPDYFQNLPAYFDREDTFAVMGRIIGWDDNKIQDGAKYPSFQNAKIKTSKNYLLENEADMKAGLFSMYVSGANAFLSKEKFLRLGGFDELFSPFYVEDFELSLRAWRIGWKCYYEHNAVCRHRTSTSICSKDKKYFIKLVSNRNKWFAHAIHLSGGKRFLWMLQLIPEVMLQTLLGKTYYLKAFISFLKNGDNVRASRNRFERLSKDQKLLSINEVAETILAAVKGKKLRVF